MKFTLKFIMLCAAVLSLLGLSGCGGGGNALSKNLGRATVNLTWPAATRLIPAATDSVRIVITQGARELARQTLNRPAQGGTVSATFTDLPVGPVTLTADALADPAATPGGTGVPLAHAVQSVTIVSGANTPVALTMVSTIDKMSLFSDTLTLFPGASVRLMPQGTTAETGALVLLSPSRLLWESSAPGIAGVDALGNVTAVSAGTVDIKVTDTESGKSGTITLTVSAGSSTGGPTEIRLINLLANDLVYDAVSQKIYASIPASVGGSLGSTVVPIDPVTQNIGTPIAVGSEPVKLALSDDGHYLYVGLDSVGAVRRIDLKTQTDALQFSLGDDGFLGKRSAETMAVMPGSPQTLAVSMSNIGVSPRHAGIAVFDNGVPRPAVTLRNNGDDGNVIVFGASPARLYGLNNETTGNSFSRYNIGPNGITLQDKRQNAIGSLSMAFSAGRIYLTDGEIIDPETFASLGSIVAGRVVPDAATNRIFVMEYANFNPAWLTVYDMTTLTRIVGKVYDGQTVKGSFIRWGPKGLAWITGTGKIALLTVSPGT